MLTIDKVDDEQEMKDTKRAFEVLLFTEESQLDLFKITAAVMHWGNQKWKQKPREEQAEADGTEVVEKVAKLLGMEIDSFINGLLKPRIKVGKEFVNKGQNQAQVTNACAASLENLFFHVCLIASPLPSNKYSRERKLERMRIRKRIA